MTAEKKCPFPEIVVAQEAYEKIQATYKNIPTNACMYVLNKTLGPLIDEFLSGVISAKELLYEASQALQSVVNAINPQVWKMYAMSTQMDIILQASKREFSILSLMKSRIGRMKRYLGNESNKKLEAKVKKLCEKYNETAEKYNANGVSSQRKKVLASRALTILETLMGILKADTSTAVGKAYAQARSAVFSGERKEIGKKLKSISIDKDIVLAQYQKNTLDAEFVNEVYGGFLDIVKLYSGVDLTFMTERIILQLEEVSVRLNNKVNESVRGFSEGVLSMLGTEMDMKEMMIKEVKKIRPRASLSSVQDSILPETGNYHNPKADFLSYTLYGTSSAISGGIGILDALDAMENVFFDNTEADDSFNYQATLQEIDDYNKFVLDSRLAFAALKIDPLRRKLKSDVDLRQQEAETKALKAYSMSVSEILTRLTDVDYEIPEPELGLQVLATLPTLVLGDRTQMAKGLDSLLKRIDLLYVKNLEILDVMKSYSPYSNASIERTLELLESVCGEEVAHAYENGKALLEKATVYYAWVGKIYETIATLKKCVGERTRSDLLYQRDPATRKTNKELALHVQKHLNKINKAIRRIINYVTEKLTPFNQATINSLVEEYHNMKEGAREFDELLVRIEMMKRAYNETLKLAERLKEKGGRL